MKDKSLRTLMVDDSENDALLIIRELKKGGYHPVYERVETAAAMKKALQEKQWDIILCDYKMPQFDAPSALDILKEANIDIPTIIISGAIGEETAVECMRSGARDYCMKPNLSRLCAVIARELEEVEIREKQKQAEFQKEAALEKLRESEANYRQLFDNAPAVIYRVDFKSGRFLKANDVICKYLGCSREEITSLSVYDILTPESRKLFLERLEKMALGIEVPEAVEYEVLDKKGKRWILQLHTKNIYDAEGRVVASDVVAHDITEHKRAEVKLQQTLDSLRNAVNITIKVLVSALEARDPYTAGHQLRVADLARAIAMEMGLDQEKMDGIRMAGSIHDIGKLSIPAEILSKPTKLTDLEFSLIKEHSQSGYEMLKDVASPWPLAQIVYQHHERLNGTGYPQKLKGNEILIEARIMGVADVVEAMASHRPYRAGLGIDVALEEIEKNKGVLYDAAVADACLRLFRCKGYKLT